MGRSKFFKKGRILYAFAIPLLGLGLASSSIVPGTATPGPAPDTPQNTIHAQADTSKKCVKKAKIQANKNKVKRYWTCIGTKARYFKKHTASSAAVAQRDDRTFTGWGVTPDDKAPGRGETVPGAKGTIQMKDIFDDDQRCELVPKCTNIRTLYRADIKGNGFYGYRDEVWGAFDVILRQAFNGASSRYNLTLIWDRGYQVDSLYWRAAVRHNSVLPDQTTGVEQFRPDYISRNRWNVVVPARGVYTRGTTPTPYFGRHHDDFSGEFIANNRMFFTSTIHLPDFHCPRVNPAPDPYHRCKYYGPTGPV